MKLTFLGTGTSFGIPVVGCDCEVCSSEDPKNRRRRNAMLLEEDGRSLLVDTPPELRLQLLDAGVGRLDAVYLTHPHADHLHGLDDLRIFSLRDRRALPVHVPAEYRREIRDRFAYIWDPAARGQPGVAVPDLELHTFLDREEVTAAGFQLSVIAFPHGYYRSYGFRAGDVAIIVDAKRIPEDAEEQLRGVRVLVLGALWAGDPHPTHFSVEEAVAVARDLGAERTYLTHMSHRLEHGELERDLPPGVHPAYDGLVVEW